MAKAALRSADYFALQDDMEADRSAITIHAVIAARPSSGLFGPKGCTPIWWCLCVQDSMQNPCPCTGPIVWVPDDWVKRSVDSGRQSSSGLPIVAIKADAKGRVYVDTTVKLGGHRGADVALVRGKDNDFSPLDQEVWIPRVRPVEVAILVKVLEALESDKNIVVMALKTGDSRIDALIAAFGLGYAIGEKLNETFGLSDAISDWLVDNLPPWPF
jgi:hypothetical protein